MDHLLRPLAPISDNGWSEIESEATRTLKHFLAARRLVPYSARGDWGTSAVPTGRVTELSADGGVRLSGRLNRSLVEMRVDFTLSRRELESLDRGAADFDTQPIVEATRRAAAAEDRAVFTGNDPAGIRGISQTPHAPILLDASLERLPRAVAEAVDQLHEIGVEGPFGIAMGPRCWTGVMQSTEHGGYPLAKHLRVLLDGPVVWAPTVAGAVLVSQRGGDFELVGGQDWAIGYAGHDAETVSLYLQQSMTFVVNAPEAAVVLGFAD